MPGGENYACHECLAWHHTECWSTHGSCSGCGNDWQKDPTSGLTWHTKPKKVEPSEDQTPQADYFPEGMPDIANYYSGTGKDSPNVLSSFGWGSNVVAGAAPFTFVRDDKVYLATPGGTIHQVTPAPACNHEFSPADHKCLHCQLPMHSVYDAEHEAQVKQEVEARLKKAIIGGRELLAAPIRPIDGLKDTYAEVSSKMELSLQKAAREKRNGQIFYAVLIALPLIFALVESILRG